MTKNSRIALEEKDLKLVAFRARNFRCLLNPDWIPIRDLTVLIGENDGGKTTTLDAISLFLSSAKKPDPTDFCKLGETSQSEIVLEGKFELQPSELELIPHNIIRDGNKVTIFRRYSLSNQTAFLVSARVHPDSRFNIGLEGTTVENLSALAAEFHIQIPKSPKLAILDAIRKWVGEQALVQGEVELPAALRQAIPEFESFENASEPQNVISQMLRRVFRDEIAKDEIRGKLSGIQTDITSKLKSEASNLKTFVQQFRDTIEDVTVEPQFNFENGFTGADIQVKERGKSFVSLAKSGTGMQRHLRLAVYQWNSGIIEKRSIEGAKPVIWAFDEPDIHLDYKSQRKLFDTIQKFIRVGVQVIICTHSINLIDRVPLQNLVHYSLDETGFTKINTFEPTAETEDFFVHQIGANMGLDNSLMFYERCFVVVEGETEMYCLPLLFETYTEHSTITEGIRLINGENNGGARLFAKYLNAKYKNVILLIDEDCKTKQPTDKLFTAKRLKADGFDVDTQVYFSAPKEFEFLFSDGIWARVGSVIGIKKDDGSSYTSEDISVLHTEETMKFHDNLKRLFRKDAMEISMALGKCVTKEEIPKVIRDCFDRAIQIANT
jgi:predicted ATP-dependent endonuclease of OLD family